MKLKGEYGSEQRKYIRVPENLPVRIKSFVGLIRHPFEPITGMTKDISSSGTCIEVITKTESEENKLKSIVPKSTHLEVEIDLPHKPKMVLSRCLVMWVEKKQALPKDPQSQTQAQAQPRDIYYFGLHFVKIDTANKEAIVNYIKDKYIEKIREEKVGAEVDITIPSIEVGNLSKYYEKGKNVVDDISFTVQRGEIFGVLGPNGAGKTSIVRILATVLSPSSGTIKVLGFDVRTQVVKIRKLIGYVPQKPALYTDLTVRENLFFFGKGFGISKNTLNERIDETLSFVDLLNRENSLVTTLSLGMQQRASLALALLHKPKVLFLDEPTAGIDPKLRKDFWDEFNRLRDVGITIFITTHQLDEAEYCNRLLFIRDGKKVICDTPENILELGKSVVAVKGKDFSRNFELKDYKHELISLFKDKILPSEKDISSIEINKSNLESIFLKLIKDKEG